MVSVKAIILVLLTIIVSLMLYGAYLLSSIKHNSSLGAKIKTNVVRKVATTEHSELDHLIIVPGHAVLHIDQLKDAAKKDDSWYLLPYQRDQGIPEALTSHIQLATDRLNWDLKAMVMFSGGETRNDVGPISEALSYFLVAQLLLGISKENLDRVFLEEYARDSYENLLFSICRFHEITGAYPQRITVVGFDFKKDRFMELHRQAIRYPQNRFFYEALTPQSNKFNHTRAVMGEEVVRKQFLHDIYGCEHRKGHVEDLGMKKHLRDPFHRTVPYAESCPEMLPLIQICNGKGNQQDYDQLYEGPLPWDP